MTPSADEHLPKPVVKKMRWPFPAVWIIPVLALIAAGYYFYDRHRERAVQITISFADGAGVRPGETSLTVHGVEVGKVMAVDLSGDHQHVEFTVDLAEKNASIASHGAKFWIVRPDFTNGNISGLGTIVAGPHIEVLPGDGKAVESHFTGQEQPPLDVGQGIKLILHTPHLDHLQANSPVYYRGIQTGVVQDVRFSGDSTQVNVTLFIWNRYAPLVRADSEFWSISGADLKGSLISGLELKLGTIRSLITGGIAFASPADKDGKPTGAAAIDGLRYELHSEAKKDWEAWSPNIPINPESAEIQDNSADTKSDQHRLPTELQGK